MTGPAALRFLGFGFVLLVLIGGAAFSSASAQGTPGLQTLTWTPSPTRTPSPTLTPSPTPTITLPDLIVTKADAPDPAVTGTILTYSIVVINQGRGASGATTITDDLPAGLSVYSLGPGCFLIGDSGMAVVCQVPALTAGGRTSFTILASITAPAGSAITNSVAVDPGGSVAESDEWNNTATTTTIITAGTPPTSTPTSRIPPPQPTAPVPTDTPVLPTSTVIAATDPTSTATPQPTTPSPTIGPGSDPVLWLLATADTPIYALSGAPAGVAKAGQWYKVARVEGAWALGHWEGDPPTAMLWIEMGPRVQVTALPRRIPTAPLEQWLLVQGATQTYSTLGVPGRIAVLGDRYRILGAESGWALVLRDTDPLAVLSWIEVDDRVALFTVDPLLRPAIIAAGS